MSFWKKKVDIAPPKELPKYRVVSKEIVLEDFQIITIIKMKNGRRFVSVDVRNTNVAICTQYACLVTGKTYAGRPDLCIGTPAILRIQHPLLSMSGAYFKGSIFTQFRDRKGNLVSVQTTDIDYMIKRSPVSIKSTTITVDELEKIDA